MMGSVVQFGSRTQAVVELSSAESELYAIGTGAQEGLHIANFIKEATTTKVNIRIHTDSTSGKSIATRIGSSKKAKHIDLKYLFIQQLVQSGNTINPQNQHTRQPSGHTHKVCPGRGAQQTPLQGGHSMPTTSQTDHRPNNVSPTTGHPLRVQYTHGCTSHGTLFS